MMVRELFVTLPDRPKLAWCMCLAWLEGAELRLIDKRPARRAEERTPRLMAFDELPVLYDEADFPVVTDDVLGWSGNLTPEGVTLTDSPWFDYA